MESDINVRFVDDSSRNYTLTLLKKLRKFSIETYAHSIDVAEKTVVLGKKLGLGKSDLKRLYTAGLLHDIGKIDLDINLLEKPKCSKEELNQIRFGHIAGTKRYLEGKIDDSIFSIAYHHHEKLNGTGYPQGLKGEQLSQLDRILQVCDVISALSMQRSYRAKLDSNTIDGILDNWVKVGELDKKYVDLGKELFVNVDDEEEIQ